MTTISLPAPMATGVPSTDRGETIIAPRVLEKIAGRAASEVDGVAAQGGSTGVGRLLPWSAGHDSPATAQGDQTGDPLRVDLSVSILYPRPVATVTNAVRAQVIRRLAELCGMAATRVDISVPALVVPAPGGRRRVE